MSARWIFAVAAALVLSGTAFAAWAVFEEAAIVAALLAIGGVGGSLITAAVMVDRRDAIAFDPTEHGGAPL
ncbi:MAG: hypothetical protein WC807_14700 [Hyphomicrobium sp.]|jgi:hypothetical protein